MAAYGGVSIIKSLLPHSVDVFFDTNENTIKIILTLIGCFVVVFYGFKIMKMKTFNGNNSNIPLTEDKIEKVVMEKAEPKLIKTEKELDRILHTQKLEKGLKGLTGEFLTGILLCLSSVTLPASWFAIVSYLKSYGVIDSKFLSGLALAIGVLTGTAVWFYVIVKFVSKNSHRINSRMLNKINISVGVILILLGVFLLLKAVDFAFL
jgi:cytochrome c biogenesis protein CcdA